MYMKFFLICFAHRWLQVRSGELCTWSFSWYVLHTDDFKYVLENYVHEVFPDMFCTQMTSSTFFRIMYMKFFLICFAHRWLQVHSGELCTWSFSWYVYQTTKERRRAARTDPCTLVGHTGGQGRGYCLHGQSYGGTEDMVSECIKQMDVQVKKNVLHLHLAF